LRVVAEAAGDDNYRNECLAQATAKDAVARIAEVQFDEDIEVRCYPDKKTVEKQIVLLLPEDEDEDGTIKDYWLCTYVDYMPANPLPSPESPAAPIANK
jgi:hypothetical protein